MLGVAVKQLSREYLAKGVLDRSRLGVLDKSRLALICIAKPRYSQSHSTMDQFRRARRKDMKSMGYVLLIIPAATFALGVWQIQRRQWKLDMIKDLEARVSEPPVPLPEDYKELADMEYRKVKVVGKFDHSREAYIMPRVNIQSDGKTPSSSGAYVITPFHVENSNDIILVNRGWIPRGKMNPETRMKAQIEDIVELVGTVRHDENRPQYTANTDSSRVIWHVRDIRGLASFLGALPVFIDADHSSTVEGGPIGGQTKVTVRNEHLQYIITWFSLSAATFLMWFKSYGRKLFLK